MGMRFMKSLPSCAKAYVPRAINKSGIREELYGKPLLVIGDVAVSTSTNEYDNISKFIDCPTITLVRNKPVEEDRVVGVGKFEISGTFSPDGRLSAEYIGYGQADVFSRKYADFFRKNPLLATAYDMQRGGQRVVSPIYIAGVDYSEIREHCKLGAKDSTKAIKQAAIEMQNMNADNYFDGLIINGNNVKNSDIEMIVQWFKNLTIPVRYIAASGTCPLTDIQSQRSVGIAQEIFNAISLRGKEFTYTQKIRGVNEGKGRVISMITKPRRI